MRPSFALVLAFGWLGCGGPVPSTDAGVDAAQPGMDAGSCASCDDELFCNGVERCESGSCVAGEPRCAADACDEDADACDGECAEPDADGDGRDSITCGGDDCDDEDGARFPGNVEICDHDHHDEDCRPDTYGFQDLDGDGYVDAACCNAQADDSLACGGDCNDMRAVSHPNSLEACDGFDNDCDEMVDEGALRSFYPDADEDGFGDASATAVTGCDPPLGHVENGGDCDDTNAYAHSAIAPEVCDGFDNDCDRAVDEETSAVPWYLDADMDLFGDASDPAPVVSCLPVPGRVTTGGDCDDALPSVHPTAAEVCNEIDDDCDAMTDEGVGITYYADADGDGRGSPTSTTVACGVPGGYVVWGDDCDDANSLVNPEASYHEEPRECGPGSEPTNYEWCPTLRCCIRSSGVCSPTARCDSVSQPNWDYDCDGVHDRDPWETGSCERHPFQLGECIGDGPIGTGTPACGAPVSYRTCTRDGLSGPCTGSTSSRPLACR